MATKPTKETTKPADVTDVEVFDSAGEAMLPATVDEKSYTPAVYSDDFDDGLKPARLVVPTMTLVHGVGEYKSKYNVGTFVIGNLERAVEITKGNLEKFRDDAKRRAEGRVSIIVVAASKPVYQPDVKPDHPNFKDELHDLASVAAANGTTDRKVAYATGKQLFVPKSECTLLVRKPDWLADEDADMFPFELDGQKWAMAKYYAKKSAFNNFVEPLRSQRLSNPKLMDKKGPDGSVIRGRLYNAVFLLGAKDVKTATASFLAPDIITSVENVGPETSAFAKNVFEGLTGLQG